MDDLNHKHVSELWVDAMERIALPPKGVYLPPWPTFSKYLGGLRPHEISLLCAPTGAGKTQWLANVSAQLLLQEVPHFAAPVETGDRDYVIRVLSAMEGKNFKALENPSVDELKSINETANRKIVNKPFWLSSYRSRVAIEDMVNLLKFMVQQGAKIAILDNLNFFLKVTRAVDQNIETDEAMRQFVMLVRSLPLHIILVCHPKKTGNEGRVESEFDIKGSSTLVQEADNVILFNRPKREDVEQGRHVWSDRELVFKKNREFGENINLPVWFRFHNCRYQEVKP